MAGEHWTFWLMVMNYALSVVVLLGLLVVMGAIVWELVAKKARKAREMKSLDEEMWAMLHALEHSLSVPDRELMADDDKEVETPRTGSRDVKP